jgi:3-oxoacyl-[acyl-carrier-protein] synthase I
MKVFVAGIGAISAIGLNTSSNFKKLKAKEHGICSLSQDIDPLLENLPIARILYSNSELASLSGTNPLWPRTALLSLSAATEAIRNSGLDINKYKTGFLSATTVGGMDLTEQFFAEYIHDSNAGNIDLLRTHACGKVSDIVAEKLGINSFVTTINTACSSSANSIILAARLIKEGTIDVAIAGGADALTSFTLNGFNTLLLLDTDLCRPFDANRKGLNLGEGAGYVVLVSEKLIEQGECKAMCELNGYANTTDSFHQTALSPNGDGPYRSMKQAIDMTNINISSIDYINLHGTATPNNDAAEGSAIVNLFGTDVSVSSTKSYTGHTLGASGGIEAVFSILALTNNTLLPNLRFQQIMPEANIGPALNAENKSMQHVLSNSFGFGGNCSSLLFSKV